MAKQHELDNLQQWIGPEIEGDAADVSKQLFGDRSSMPDVGRTDEGTALDMMRNKFLANDREWLIGEAKRDPLQFLALTQKLGVTPADGSPAPAPVSARNP